MGRILVSGPPRLLCDGYWCVFSSLVHRGCCGTDIGVSSLVWSTEAVVGRILVCLL